MALGDPTPTSQVPPAYPPTFPPQGPPPAAPVAPAPYGVAPPAFPDTQGWAPPTSGPGAPPPPFLRAPGPTGSEPPKGRKGAGRGLLVALLLVMALVAGGIGGVAYGRASAGGETTASAPTVDPGTSQLPSNQIPGGSSRFPDGSSQFPGSGSEQTPQEVPSNGTADTSSVASAVTPGIVNINTLTAEGEGAGTGMLLTDDGIVLTNNHVISGATKIVVTDADSGDQYDAKVVGTAPTKDVAVLQLVDATGLDTVSTGDSDGVKTGDPVVALGNAGGKGGMPTVVSGTVVALDRSITASDATGGNSQRMSGLIQIDANIQPGDSGGPLADADGKVIGINSAASSDGRGSTTGEGYAIPINTALDLVDQIRSGKGSDIVHIGVRGVLGVQVVPSGSVEGAGSAGAPVAAVASGSGAAKAGVTAGSTITSLDGKRISTAEDLTTALGGAKPGAKVELGWTDGAGQSHTATVTLTEGPPD